MSEWGVYWQALSVIATAIVGGVGIYKIYHELNRLTEQRNSEQTSKDNADKLKRTEFFLAQHRRLFDDKDLYEILCLIDSDSPALASHALWDKKRKFLTFIEEIALLVRSKQINHEVAYYMFGYYACCAMYGYHFNIGLIISPEHWGLFYEFTQSAEIYLSEHPNGPKSTMQL